MSLFFWLTNFIYRIELVFKLPLHNGVPINSDVPTILAVAQKKKF